MEGKSPRPNKCSLALHFPDRPHTLRLSLVCGSCQESRSFLHLLGERKEEGEEGRRGHRSERRRGRRCRLCADAAVDGDISGGPPRIASFGDCSELEDKAVRVDRMATARDLPEVGL